LFISVLFLFAIAGNGCGSGSGSAVTDTTAAAVDTTKAVAAEPAPNTLTDAEKADGWRLLFNGTDTSGWHVFNHKSDGSAWKVVDASIFLDTTNKKDWQVVGGG